MVKQQDSELPYQHFAEQGSDAATPASGLWTLYFKAGGLYARDDAGSVVGPFAVAAGGGVSGDAAVVRVTSGDISVPQPTMATLGISDITIAATAGDYLEIGVSCRSTDSDADSWGLDVATMVSGSPVNFLSSHSGTADTTGVGGWYGGVSNPRSVTGSVLYVVQSGDISGGNVTLRLFGRASGGGKTIAASATGALEFWAKNHLH